MLKKYVYNVTCPSNHPYVLKQSESTFVCSIENRVQNTSTEWDKYTRPQRDLFLGHTYIEMLLGVTKILEIHVQAGKTCYEKTIRNFYLTRFVPIENF